MQWFFRVTVINLRIEDICVQVFVTMSLLLGSYENVTMWINNICLLVGLISSLRIMGRPMLSCVTVKIVIKTIRQPTQREQRSMPILRVRWKLEGRDHLVTKVSHLVTKVSHVFDNRTVDITFLPINQTAISRMTNKPVVYVALDEELSAELFPESEVQWRCSLFHSKEELWRQEHPLQISPANLASEWSHSSDG